MMVDGWLIEVGYEMWWFLWIWGSGYVGCVLVLVLVFLLDFCILWIDIVCEWFLDVILFNVD